MSSSILQLSSGRPGSHDFGLLASFLAVCPHRHALPASPPLPPPGGLGSLKSSLFREVPMTQTQPLHARPSPSRTRLAGLTLAAALLAAAPGAWAQAAGGPFTLAPLPYASDALEPAIDKATMELHHGKHHQAYVNNLNNAIAGDAKLSQLTLQELVAKAGKHPAAVRNNAGGHWNHTFFWNIMGPAEKSGTPSPELLKAINDEFGSLDAFKAAFSKAGLSRFGSGWVWLIVDKKGKLVITTTPNQDNPLMDVAETRGTPIL